MAVSKDDVQDATGQRTNLSGLGFLRGIGIAARYAVTANTINNVKGNPIQGEIGYAPGATFQNPYATATGQYLFVNIGTFASANWLNIA